jgi:hypothetical protein
LYRERISVSVIISRPHRSPVFFWWIG